MKSGKDQNAAGFQSQSDDVFGRIASRYDLLSDLFSLGIHRLWKREIASTICSSPWNTLLDGASGTGDIVLKVLDLTDAQGKVITVSDSSPAMLDKARFRLRSRQLDEGILNYAILDVENMSKIADESIDCFSFSLGAKICDRSAVFNEANRILCPGGRIVVLEASVIPNRFVHWLYLRYMNFCMPVIGRLATGGDSSAYLYLLRGIEEFPTAENLAAELTDVGFGEVSFKRLTFGIVAVHVGTKKNAAHA